jgi:hypothetical protein
VKKEDKSTGKRENKNKCVSEDHALLLLLPLLAGLGFF